MRCRSLAALPKPVLVLVLLCCGLDACGEDWPGWRGPRGDGSSRDEAPLKWDGKTGENIRWAVEVPGLGHASPVIVGDRVLLASCLPEQEERVLVCLDRDSGRQVWQRTILKSPLETKHRLNSHASSTPASDGEHVFVSFLHTDGRTIPAPNVGTPRPITPGQMVIACYTLEGERVWESRPGEFVSAHGYCACPVLFENLVIVNGDHDGKSYVVALDKKSGKEVWRTPRKYGIRSYVTPLIREIDGRTQMVFSGSKRIISLDPRTGEPIWWVEGPTEQFVASMVYDGEKFYMAAGFPTYHVMAVRPTGRGDVTDTHVAWHSTKARCYVPSPVVIDKYLIVADDRGTVNCFDTASGETLWKERIAKHYSASLISNGKHAYLVADDGVTTVIEAGPSARVVAENPLGEFSFASPAISDGQLFIRGEQRLYCIQQD